MKLLLNEFGNPPVERLLTLRHRYYYLLVLTDSELSLDILIKSI